MAYLPPLNALKAFWAASRHNSFSDAADELNVTHGAVSRHIRGLEEILGVALFHRLPRGVELTDEGKGLAFTVQRAFDDLAEAVGEMRRGADEKVVTISTVPSIAARWLAPRLEAFQRDNPDVEMRISTTVQLVDLDRGEVDFVIRYGRGIWPGVTTELLFPMSLSVVCVPGLMEARSRPLSYTDLGEYRLIVADGFPYWRAWFREAGAPDVKPRSILDVVDANVAIQAVLAGQGIALLPEVLVRAELGAGRLVRAFPERVESKLGYFLGYDEHKPVKPHVRAAIDWVREEAARDENGVDRTLLG